MDLALVLTLIQQLPKVVAAAPEFANLFHELIKGFGSHEQDQLKSAYAAARAASDSAQDDFVDASRGG